MNEPTSAATQQPTSLAPLTLDAPQRRKPPRHLADLDPADRRSAVESLGHRGFRARQLSTHYFARLVDSAEDMTDLPRAVRDELVAALLPTLLTPLRHRTTDEGRTVKSVWRLHDGALVESVLMRYPHRVTICVSSQAGCGMGCPFCATGQGGLTRNLSTAEIVEQVVAAARTVRGGGLPGGGHDEPSAPLRVSNVVIMGMGEALANYRNAVGALRRLTDPSPDGLGISARRVVVSTVGLVPAMDKLAAEGIPVTLALSLHAPDDTLRDELIPVNARWNVDAVLNAAHRHFVASGRRVSIEYALIRDVNDQAWRADLLADRLAARGRAWVHVNPIPLNPTSGSRWTSSRPGVQQQFVERLRAHGIPTTVRDTRGRDIDGACGQLAASTA